MASSTTVRRGVGGIADVDTSTEWSRTGNGRTIACQQGPQVFPYSSLVQYTGDIPTTSSWFSLKSHRPRNPLLLVTVPRQCHLTSTLETATAICIIPWHVTVNRPPGYGEYVSLSKSQHKKVCGWARGGIALLLVDTLHDPRTTVHECMHMHAC